MLSALPLAAQSAQSAAEQAKEAYDAGNFREAIDILQKEKETQKEQGLESAALYYNLGNAYYRLGDMGNARLSYERALLLNPGDADTRKNIEFLKTKLEDQILVADTFFLHTWFRDVRSLFSSDGWTQIGIGAFVLLILSLVAFFFSRNILIKKTAFYIGIVLVVIIVFANVFAYNQKSGVEVRNTAVVMSRSAFIYSAPDANSTSLIQLHQGTKVHVTKEDRSWLEVEIDNGTVGWMKRENIEII